MKLRPNQSAGAIEIPARKTWVGTGVELEAGATYLLTARGTWIDWWRPATAAGYRSPNGFMKLAERRRRVPDSLWFALIGTLGRDMSTAFVIGEECQFIPRTSGELVCFANDVRGFYWNNRGKVDLFVGRLS
jgi:hypothetical protein